MNDILSNFEFLTSGVSPVFRVISLILGFVLIVVGFVLKHKNKSSVKETVGWICIGIGIVSVISNVIQLLI